MFHSVPIPQNEPVFSYAPGTKDRELLEEALKELSSQQFEIPAIIGGKEVFTGNTGKCVCPHDHKHVLGTYHKVGEKEIRDAIEASCKARKEWENMPFSHRSAIFLKAAELLTTKYRYKFNAITMLGQSKNADRKSVV